MGHESGDRRIASDEGRRPDCLRGPGRFQTRPGPSTLTVRLAGRRGETVARWIRQPRDLFIHEIRRREDFGVSLVLGFAAGVVASIIALSVVLEVLERVPPP